MDVGLWASLLWVAICIVVFLMLKFDGDAPSKEGDEDE